MQRNNVLQAMHDVFFVPDHLNTQEMCNEAVCMVPYSLEFVAGHLKTQEICDEALRREPYTLRYVPDHLKTQEMCDEALRIIFSDTKGICNDAVSFIIVRHRGCGHESFL